jgi:hypothetical protein
MEPPPKRPRTDDGQIVVIKGAVITKIIYPRVDNVFRKRGGWGVFKLRVNNTFFTAKGPVRFGDRYHTMDLYCRKEIDDYKGRKKWVYAILKTLKVVPRPLSGALLVEMLQEFGGFTKKLAEWRVREMSPAAKSGIVQAFANEVVTRPWLHGLNDHTSYFGHIFLNDLCPPFKKEMLGLLAEDQIGTLYWLAMKTPWKLYFPSLRPSPHLEDISADTCFALSRKYNTPIQQIELDAMKFYAGHTRTQEASGHIYTLRNVLESTADANLVGFLENEGVLVAKPGKNADTGCLEERIYCKVDLDYEDFISGYMGQMLRTDESTTMKDFCKCWPNRDKNAPKLTEEQEMAVHVARTHRISVVCGRAGTGKTSMVIRSIRSSFMRGEVLMVALSGIACRRLKRCVGPAFTAHLVIHSVTKKDSLFYTQKFWEKKVLFVEEASTMPLKIFSLLIRCLPMIERIYFVGDHNQMLPPSGGIGVLHMFYRIYQNTGAVAILRHSQRLNTHCSKLARNLDRILSGDARLEYDPEYSEHTSFVLLQRADSLAENVRKLRELFGNRPDSEMRMQIMVQKNDTRMDMVRLWYQTGPYGHIEYKEHAFFVGETVMFLKNHYGSFVAGYGVSTGMVQNGLIEQISRCYDVCGTTHAIKECTNTGEPQSFHSSYRFIELKATLTTICLNVYSPTNIIRSQPATIAKMQGQETDTAVVFVHEGVSPERFESRTFYTACSRGKKQCIVMANLDGDGTVPSRELQAIITTKQDLDKCQTSLWEKLPNLE